MKLSEKPHIKARIESFKAERSTAQAKGIDILPSIHGPYAVKDGKFIGLKGTAAYKSAISA